MFSLFSFSYEWVWSSSLYLQLIPIQNKDCLLTPSTTETLWEQLGIFLVFRYHNFILPLREAIFLLEPRTPILKVVLSFWVKEYEEIKGRGRNPQIVAESGRAKNRKTKAIHDEAGIQGNFVVLQRHILFLGKSFVCFP